MPLLAADQPLFVTSASGVSGAGKKAELAYSFCEVAGNYKAYSPGAHRHEPEMRQELGLPAGSAFTFVPHLLPGRLAGSSRRSTSRSRSRSPTPPSPSGYVVAYAGRPFVRVHPAGRLPELKEVVGTPRAHVGWQLLGGRAPRRLRLRDRQPPEGGRLAGGPEPEPGLRAARDGGTPVTDVVKLGGSLLENRELRHAALEAVATAWTSGKRSIVVHGGGKRIDAMLAALDIPKKVQGGLRVTDAETLDVVVSILSGLVNKTLVAELRARGILRLGDLRRRRRHALGRVPRGGRGGRPRLRRPRSCGATRSSSPAVLSAGFLPLVASVALGREGTLLNVNADAAASALAGALGAKKLVFLTDVEGRAGRERQA